MKRIFIPPPNPVRVYCLHYKALQKHRQLAGLPDLPPPAPANNFTLLPDRLALISWLPPGIGAEIGVATGEFSAQILETLQPRELHLFDLWRGRKTVVAKEGGERGYQIVQERFAREIAAGTIHLHRGPSFARVRALPNAFFDWVYLDACRHYPAMAKDLRSVARKIKPGGYICGNDYTRWGNNGLVRYGVVEAVNEFCATHGWKLACLTNEPHRHISYALRKED